MAVILSDDEVSNNEFGSDEDGNFIAFTATAVVDESVAIEENPSDGELSEMWRVGWEQPRRGVRHAAPGADLICRLHI